MTAPRNLACFSPWIGNARARTHMRIILFLLVPRGVRVRDRRVTAYSQTHLPRSLSMRIHFSRAERALIIAYASDEACLWRVYKSFFLLSPPSLSLSLSLSLSDPERDPEHVSGEFRSNCGKARSLSWFDLLIRAVNSISRGGWFC